MGAESMRRGFVIAAGTAVLLAGCSADRSVAPPAEGGDWSMIRYHESQGGDAGYRDLGLHPDGSLEVIDGRGGGELSARGLLAGERLETLVRLIGDLPLHAYAPLDGPCAGEGYFLSVTRQGRVRSYSSGPCDPSAPAVLRELHDQLSDLAAEFQLPRADVVPFRTLASGTRSGIRDVRRVVVESREELLRLLREHDPEQGTVGLPRVDFDRQVVIGLFLGETDGQERAVTPELAERTENGWIRVSYVVEEPGAGCPVATGNAEPFCLIAVERSDSGFLFETRTATGRCG
jgi:hypothetical protein